jgi:hypothetical protein
MLLASPAKVGGYRSRIRAIGEIMPKVLARHGLSGDKLEIEVELAETESVTT